MQKVKSLWISSCFGNLLFLPPPPRLILSGPIQEAPQRAMAGQEGGRGRGRGVCRPWGWLLYFLSRRGDTSICTRGQILGGWVVSAQLGSVHRDHRWQMALAATWWRLFLGPKGWEWLRPCSLWWKRGMLFLVSKEALAERRFYHLCGRENLEEIVKTCINVNSLKVRRTPTHSNPLPLT